VNIGDIHWVELPAANGREQAGRRPAIILQDDGHASASPMVLVVPLTTSKAALRFPGTIQVDPTPENGLSHESVALVFQLRAIDRKRVKERLGKLAPEVVTGILAQLDRLTGR
jgi:mRNA interferase MazF